jgi:hypothetical protein
MDTHGLTICVEERTKYVCIRPLPLTYKIV